MMPKRNDLQERQFSANNWITALSHEMGGPAAPLADFRHAYDKEGNKTFENGFAGVTS
jgi:hypothetical protein